MKSRFHEAAAAELIEAVEYYDATAEGLGDRLFVEVNKAVGYIEQFPESAAVVDYNVCRKVLSRFPYSMLYVIEQGEVIILTIAHQSRRPNYWLDRLRPSKRVE